MKKFFPLLLISVFLGACNTTQQHSPSNEQNAPAEQQSTTNHEHNITTPNFSIHLPEQFSIVEKDGGYNIVKTDSQSHYFYLSLFTKEDQELLKKCKNVELVESAEELEHMSDQELQAYEACQGPQARLNIEDLNIIYTTKNGELWILEGGHDLPTGEESTKTYAKTLQAFGVTETIVDEHGDTNLIPQQLVEYFKTNTYFIEQ